MIHKARALAGGSSFLVGLLILGAASAVAPGTVSAFLSGIGSGAASKGGDLLAGVLRLSSRRKKVFNHDLAHALRASLEEAIRVLERAWERDHGVALERSDPALARLCAEQFPLLRKQCRRGLTDELLQEGPSEAEIRGILAGDSHRMGRLLVEGLGLDQALWGHDERFRGYVETRLVEYWALAFLDFLKDPERGTQAFRAYQIGLYAWLEDGLRELQVEQRETGADHGARLEDIQKRLAALEAATWKLDPDALALLQDMREQLEDRLELGAVALSMDLGIQRLQKEFETLNRRVRAQLPGVYVWDDMDVGPSPPPRGDVLVGERPQPRHLREGYIANRPRVYGRLMSVVRRWMNDVDDKPDRLYRVPVCWIGGRSGCGKSMALLWVASMLHRLGRGPVYYLGTAIQQLPAVLRMARGEGVRPIVVLDDPYLPADESAAEAWRSALGELIAARQGVSGERLPWIVCCGPSDHRELLRRDFLEDLVIEGADVPRESTVDVQVMREFFRCRTGQLPPESDDPNVLLVQLFFEWRGGETLQQFARRFRERVRAASADAGIDGFLSELLALNRLYVGYPQSAVEARLTPIQRSQVRKLLQEEHLSVQGEGGLSELWFAHAHLANAIYEAWDFEAEQTEEHYREVVDVCRAHAETFSGQMAPVWAIAKALGGARGGSDMARRLDATVMDRVLSRSYSALLDEYGEDIPLPLLPAWIEAAAVLGWETDRDPVELALGRLDVEPVASSGFTLLCGKLIEHHPRFSEDRRRRVVSAVRDLLDRVRAWEQWSTVARFAARVTGDEQVLALLAARMEDEDEHRWGSTWLHLWQSLPPEGSSVLRQRLVDVASERIASQPDGPKWSQIWECLHLEAVQNGEDDRRETLERLASVWLETHEREVYAAFVWERMLDSASDRGAGKELQALLHQGLRLLPVHRDRRAWSFIWERLWQHVPIDSPVREDIVRSGHAWVARRQHVEGWSFVWEKLAAPGSGLSPEDQGRLLKVGLEWLEGREDRLDWSRVWEPLMDARPRLLEESDRDEVVRRGTAWLEDRAGREDWPHVWQYLVRRARTDRDLDALRDLGAQASRALRLYEGRSSWVFLVEGLLALAPKLPEVVPAEELGRRMVTWLAENGDQRQWPEAWNHVTHHHERLGAWVPAEALAALGVAWLRSNVDSPVFGYVAHGLWRVIDRHVPESDREWLADRSIELLELQAEADSSRPSTLCRALLSHAVAVGDEALLTRGLRAALQLLDASPKPRLRVWQRLLVHHDHLEVQPRARTLYEMGLGWLNEDRLGERSLELWYTLVHHGQRYGSRASTIGLVEHADRLLARPLSARSRERVLYDALKQARLLRLRREGAPILRWAHLWMQEMIEAHGRGEAFDPGGWCKIWREGLQVAGLGQDPDRVREFLDSGYRALENDWFSPEEWPMCASFILRHDGHLRLGGDREERLVARVRAWLRGPEGPAHRVDGYLYDQLLYRLHRESPEIQRATVEDALRWMGDHLDGWSWDRLWQHLRKMARGRDVQVDLDCLAELAARWLQANDGDSRWPRMWHDLWGLYRDLRRHDSFETDRHLALGLEWALRVPSTQQDWGAVFVGLLGGRAELGDRFEEQAEELQQKARRWLGERSASRSFYWPLTWRELWLWTRGSGLLDLGEEWVAAQRISRLALSAVLEILLENAAPDSTARESGWEYLRWVPRHRSGWQRILAIMESTADDDEGARLRGLRDASA